MSFTESFIEFKLDYWLLLSHLEALGQTQAALTVLCLHTT